MRLRKGTAATLSVAAGAAASATFARTGPGAVLHAACTAAATVATFVACYALAAIPAEWRHRAAIRATRVTTRLVPLPPAPEPSGTMTVEAIDEHWQRDDRGVNVGKP